jgi:hypothetical protein
MSDNPNTTLSLATATPGGGFPAYGTAFAQGLRSADPLLVIEPRNTQGSGENVGLLARGEVDLALVAGDIATTALGRGQGITLMAAMYAQPGFFGVLRDSPLNAIAELRGRRVAWGARSSGFIVLARQIMGGLGLDIERDFEAVFLERAGDGPAMVMDGRVAALWGGGAGWPGFAAIAAGPGGLRFIAPDASERARILAAQPSLRPMVLPAGSYQGQTAPVESVGTWSLVLARPGLPEEVGLRIAAAIRGGAENMARLLPQAAETTLENTAAALADQGLIHPGMRRFLREAGLLPG